MSWDIDRSKRRVEENDYSDFDIKVADLSRTMDFSNLGTQDVRRVQGAHIYIDVPNFHLAVDDAGGDKQKQRKLLRAASVFRKVQGDLLRSLDVEHIQRQTARLHALCYRPYNDDSGKGEARRAKRAVVTAITMNSFVYDVFNVVFGEVRNLNSSAGIASGESYVANIGFHSERELISLGSPANLGAKIIDQAKRDSITITEAVYSVLPDFLKEHFKKSRVVHSTTTYQSVGLRWRLFPDLAEKLGIIFNTDAWIARTENYRDERTLSEMNISEAIELIDINSLTERNSKRTSAAAIFADLDGFTKYVRDAENDDRVVSLVRTFHMIRAEFHAVIQKDYPGLVLQHQGDRVFAITHLPSGDSFDKRCSKAVDIAIALQSSMEEVLNRHLGDRKDIHVAIGVDIGQTLITRLGKQGQREVICLGRSVSSAEELQLSSSGREIRISAEIYDALKDGVKKDQFKETREGDYVATGLTFSRLDSAEGESAAKSNRIGAGVIGDRIAVITSQQQQQQFTGNTKPWSSK